ncbi:MAG: hypothetical protein JJT89_18090 [Nitriliruptoraceae bacterium]|nr:hypothetical protein [Nitriliruptoraceae bacterium]
MSASIEPMEPLDPVRGAARLVARTQAGRRRTVGVFVLLLVVTGAAGAFWDLPEQPVLGIVTPIVTLLGMAGAVGVGILIRLSIGSTADLPDEQLDERLVAERNRAHVDAYRLIATFFLLIAVFADGLNVRFDISPLLGALMPVAAPLVLFLPSALIAWYRPDL